MCFLFLAILGTWLRRALSHGPSQKASPLVSHLKFKMTKKYMFTICVQHVETLLSVFEQNYCPEEGWSAHLTLTVMREMVELTGGERVKTFPLKGTFTTFSNVNNKTTITSNPNPFETVCWLLGRFPVTFLWYILTESPTWYVKYLIKNIYVANLLILYKHFSNCLNNV